MQQMNFYTNLWLNGYSAVLLLILFLQSMRHVDRRSFQHRIYQVLLLWTFYMLIIDTLARLDGNPGTVREFINKTANFQLFLFHQVIASLWLIYVGSQVYQEKKKIKQLLIPIAAVFIVNTILVILTPTYGIYYTIDANNIYHRSDYNFIAYLLTLFLIVYATAIAIKNRRLMEKKQFFSLMLFMVVPVVGVLVQFFVYGLSLSLSGVSIALLIIYINVQNHTIFTDYLTELNNRLKLELFLKEKIASASPQKTFSAIMLDINDFKKINDVHGHDVGDEVLRVSAKLLKGCLCPDDFIARFGGDEFFIVLNVSEQEELQTRIDKLQFCISRYNSTTEKPYNIFFSMGYKVYDPNSGMTADDFEKQLDILMYADKQDFKNRQKGLQN